MKKKVPLTKEDHLKLAKDLRKAQEILEPWVDRFYDAYSVRGKEVGQLLLVLRFLSSKICCVQDNHWYQIPHSQNEGHNTPYYGSGKKGWI